jgi:hypothetical protein
MMRTTKPLFIFNESGFAHNMLRTRWGTLCRQTRWASLKGVLMFISALLASCLLTVTLFTGTTNADAFSAWLSHDLLLTTQTTNKLGHRHG